MKKICQRLINLKDTPSKSMILVPEYYFNLHYMETTLKELFYETDHANIFEEIF